MEEEEKKIGKRREKKRRWGEEKLRVPIYPSKALSFLLSGLRHLLKFPSTLIS